MYNRYIPQPDGSYRRNRMQDASSNPPPRSEPRQEESRKPEPPREECSPEPERPPCQIQQPCAHMRPPCRQPSPPPRQKQTSQGLGVGSFLRQLLPKDFCTEDLLIVLLLLLMAGDCQEDQKSALLTLALYLFM